MKRYSWTLALIASLLLGLFLRLHHLDELFYFTHDEETVVWRVMPLLRDHNLFLLGGVTPFHVHLGPWFYYLSAVILWLSKLNPLGWGIGAAVVSAMTMGMLFILTRKLYGLFPSLIAVVLYACSFLMVVFDRHWWPLSLGPLISLVVIYCLVKITQENLSSPAKALATVGLSLSLALGFHTDPSNWALVLLAVAVGCVHVIPIKARSSLIRNLHTFSIKHKMTPILFSVLIFILSFLPLAAFDLKNHGENLLFFRQYLTETKPHQGWSIDRFIWTALYVPRTLGRLIYSPQTELTQLYSYCPQYAQGRINSASWLTTLIATVVIILFLWPKSSSPKDTSGVTPKSSSEVAVRTPRTVDVIIKWYFALVFIGLNIYGNFFSSDLFDHYLVTLFPLFFLAIAGLLSRIRPRFVAVFVALVILVINLNSFRHLSNQFGYADKQAAVTWVTEKLAGQPFSLDVLGSCFRYSGIRYLFTLAGHEPDVSFVDPNFFWLYKSPPKTTYPNKHVVFVMLGVTEPQAVHDQYLKLLGHVLKRQQFGAIDALIVDNTDYRFTIPFSQ